MGFDFCDGGFRGESVFLAQDRNGAVFDKLVGPANADDGNVYIRIAKLFHNGGSVTIVQNVVFESADDFAAAGEKFERGDVHRFDPARVDKGNGNTFRFEEAGGFFGHFKHVAKAEEGDLATWLDDFGFADFEDFWGGFGNGSSPCTARIADGGGTILMVRHGPEHVDKFVFVARLHEDQAGDVAEVTDVEKAVVGGAVVAA